MINSQTAVLEKNTVLSGEFATEPFEVAWSREARWYFQHVEGDLCDVEIVTQVSPDGLSWVDLGGDVTRTQEAKLTTWSVCGYGAWLRARGVVPEGKTVTARIYLALKE